MSESKDLPSEMMKAGGHDHFAAIAEDNESYRAACQRANNPWRMEIPAIMPLPAMDGQSLTWGKNICGFWQYRWYLAINGKWVDMDPEKKDYHPFGKRKLE